MGALECKELRKEANPNCAVRCRTRAMQHLVLCLAAFYTSSGDSGWRKTAAGLLHRSPKATDATNISKGVSCARPRRAHYMRAMPFRGCGDVEVSNATKQIAIVLPKDEPHIHLAPEPSPE